MAIKARGAGSSDIAIITHDDLFKLLGVCPSIDMVLMFASLTNIQNAPLLLPIYFREFRRNHTVPTYWSGCGCEFTLL
jgi:hypothetical protein